MAIPAETIEQIAAANDIVEVIGGYFPLKRAGTNFKALCPFHQERTPSLVVSPQRQTFHCFGCGVGGSVFRFVMDYEHVDFPAAVRKLASRAGIAIVEERREESGQHEARRTLLELHAAAAEWFHENLMKREIGASARKYLKGRGITGEIAKSWKLGFAPSGWDAFSSWALAEGYSQRDLISSGLVSAREGEEKSEIRNQPSCYDRFRNRLMFPICNDVGEVIAFSGRTLDDSATAAKYLNSPETPLFRKGQILFGLHRSKRALIEANSAIICEGQLDLITLFEAGIQNVVAPQGTAFTEHQARVLKRFVASVLLCFDSDSAGEKAAERSLGALLQSDLIVRVAEIPPGEDPDSLVRHSGRQAFEKLVENAPDFFDYLLEKKTRAIDLNSVGEKMRVARELASSVAELHEPMMRGVVLSKMAARMGVPLTDFEKLVARDRRSGDGRGLRPAQAKPAAAPPHDIAMLCLLALRDEDARDVLLAQNWREILQNLDGADLLMKILAADLQPSDPASLNSFQTTLAPEEESVVSSWLLERLPAEPATVAREWWNGLRQRIFQRELEAAESRLRLPNLTTGEIMQLQKQVLDLRGQLHELPRFSSARAHQP